MRCTTRAALACYPPSWRARYGEELAELADRPGVAGDLLLGAARAWARPLPAGSASARRVRAISTVHVAWCLSLLAALAYQKAVDDPPVPGLTTGASQPLWGIEKATFFTGWALVGLTGTLLLIRLVQQRDREALRAMRLPAGLAVLVAGTAPLIGPLMRGSAAPSLGPLLVVLTWLLLCVLLVVTGAVGPVRALRQSQLPAGGLSGSMLVALAVTVLAVVLALSATAQAAALSSRVGAHVQVPMWVAVAVLVSAATSSGVSVRRALAR